MSGSSRRQGRGHAEAWNARDLSLYRVFLLTAEREQLCLSLTLPVASAATLLFPVPLAPWSLSKGIQSSPVVVLSFAKQINNNALNARATFFTLKTNNTVEQHTFAAFSEFPKVHSHLVGLKNRDLFFVSSTKTALWSDTVTRLDTFSGKQDRYFYGDDFLVEEHISVNPNANLAVGTLLARRYMCPVNALV